MDFGVRAQLPVVPIKSIFCFLFCFFSFLKNFLLHWVFVAACGLFLVVVSGGYSSLRCAGFSLKWFLLLQSTGSRHAGSVVVAHGLSSCGSWALLLHGMWDLPRPGLEPMSPALAGGFLTTAPPGKPSFWFLIIYFWLCWVFVAACGLSLVVASGDYSSLRCTGFSLRWLLLLQSAVSRRSGFSSCSMRAQ